MGSGFYLALPTKCYTAVITHGTNPDPGLDNEAGNVGTVLALPLTC